ncbi:flagellar biosynthetic protein FliR [Indiicoccus explosivorum]|uniref:flagellar biosynthetic protein FliR n=1 Tax=Indiicoccus explosivorum TaxID=1917864 RepID=UPI000B434C1E|nr:flagellar biosynthetic protein FliR [Indiicoccus explosivorum]
MADLIPDIPVMTLILVRVTAFFVTVPLFSYRTIPPNLRIIFAVLIAWMMAYTVPAGSLTADTGFILLIMKEAIVGLLLGLLAYIVISVIQLAGSFIDFQMGFAIANVIDPQTGAQSPLVGQFFNILALLLLLALNGHHLLLDGLFYSYQFVPLESAWPQTGDDRFGEFIAKTFTAAFAIAFQMAAPIVASLFLTDLALGITARTVPQLNIFVIGFPVKIAVAFILLLIMMGVIVAVMQSVFGLMTESMRALLTLLNGG